MTRAGQLHRQATVASFDDRTRTGAVLLDDGLRLPIARHAVPDVVRRLRPGQRVVLVLSGPLAPGNEVPTVQLVQLPGVPPPRA